jgi:hypothetical protein
VFPGKGMLSQDQDVVEESLVRQYIRLLLTWFIYLGQHSYNIHYNIHE